MYGVVEQRPAVLLRESPFVYFLLPEFSLLPLQHQKPRVTCYYSLEMESKATAFWFGDSNLTRRFKLHEGQSSIASYTAGHLVLSHLIKA